jgi:hypothetical protein
MLFEKECALYSIKYGTCKLQNKSCIALLLAPQKIIETIIMLINKAPD